MLRSRIITTIFILLCFICIPVDAQQAGNSFSENGNIISERNSNSANKTEIITDKANGLMHNANNLNYRSLANTASIITTIAGTGSAAFSGDNGAATSAQIRKPRGIAVDTSGNVYFADNNNHRVRKITKSSGIITTIAGTGSSGYSGDGGAATSAILYYPEGLAVDSSGNVYIAANYNQRVRKITVSSGIIDTIAGSSTSGGYSGDGGAATSATLWNAQAVALDSSGNVYIADNQNHRIRKVTISVGVITTVVGTGTAGFSGDGGAATSALIYYPNGFVLDSSDNIYIAVGYNHRIRKVTASTGIIETIAGNGASSYNGDNIAATSASLKEPTGVAVDSSGNVYIGDFNNNRIRKVSNGIITTFAGTGSGGYNGDGGDPTSTQVNNPYHLAVDASDNIYFTDDGNNRVRKISSYTTTDTPTLAPTIAPTTPSYAPTSTSAPTIALQSVASLGTNRYHDVAISSSGKYMYVCVTDVGIYRSDDYGVTWDFYSSNTNYYAIATSGDGLYVYAAKPYVYKSSDYGVTWSVSGNIISANWWAISTNFNGSVVVVSPYEGQPDSAVSNYVSTDYGETWSAIPSTSSLCIISVAMNSEGSTIYFAHGDCSGYNNGGSYVYKSTDYGSSITAITALGTNAYRQITTSGSGQYVYVMTSSSIKCSTDYGSTWATCFSTASYFDYQDTYSIASDASGKTVLFVTSYAQLSQNYALTFTSILSGIQMGSCFGKVSGDGNVIIVACFNGYIYTFAPSEAPTFAPSVAATTSAVPTRTPTFRPSCTPTSSIPTVAPTKLPSFVPTAIPTAEPTAIPTAVPTAEPTAIPTAIPTAEPTAIPTAVPTAAIPSNKPTRYPSSPTFKPSTGKPSRKPSSDPTVKPSKAPSPQPSRKPTSIPSRKPSQHRYRPSK